MPHGFNFHVKRSISKEKLQSFIDAFEFYNYFPQESLYDVFLQIIIALENNV